MLLGLSITAGERDEACSMHGRGEKCIQNFAWKPEGMNHLEDPRVDGRKVDLKIYMFKRCITV
jgi:hypothetical protein